MFRLPNDSRRPGSVVFTLAGVGCGESIHSKHVGNGFRLLAYVSGYNDAAILGSFTFYYLGFSVFYLVALVGDAANNLVDVTGWSRGIRPRPPGFP